MAAEWLAEVGILVVGDMARDDEAAGEEIVRARRGSLKDSPWAGCWGDATSLELVVPVVFVIVQADVA